MRGGARILPWDEELRIRGARRDGPLEAAHVALVVADARGAPIARHGQAIVRAESVRLRRVAHSKGRPIRLEEDVAHSLSCLGIGRRRVDDEAALCVARVSAPPGARCVTEAAMRDGVAGGIMRDHLHGVRAEVGQGHRRQHCGAPPVAVRHGGESPRRNERDFWRRGRRRGPQWHFGQHIELEGATHLCATRPPPRRVAARIRHRRAEVGQLVIELDAARVALAPARQLAKGRTIECWRRRSWALVRATKVGEGAVGGAVTVFAARAVRVHVASNARRAKLRAAFLVRAVAAVPTVLIFRRARLRPKWAVEVIPAGARRVTGARRGVAAIGRRHGRVGEDGRAARGVAQRHGGAEPTEAGGVGQGERVRSGRQADLHRVPRVRVHAARARPVRSVRTAEAHVAIRRVGVIAKVVRRDGVVDVPSQMRVARDEVIDDGAAGAQLQLDANRARAIAHRGCDGQRIRCVQGLQLGQRVLGQADAPTRRIRPRTTAEARCLAAAELSVGAGQHKKLRRLQPRDVAHVDALDARDEALIGVVRIESRAVWTLRLDVSAPAECTSPTA